MDAQKYSEEQEERCEHCGAVLAQGESEPSAEEIIHQYLLDYYK
ncbi:hypothetical protein [Thermoactinomyces mirandus]|nr:hypothetical protein [Thermoactinomyces mirandus]